MATYTIPNSSVGLPARQTDDTFAHITLFTGDTPVTTTNEVLVDQNAALPAFSVVGRITASGKVTLCDLAASDGSQKPIGITTAPAADVGADQGICIFRSGMFNPAALNWHASFDSAAKKRLAFEASQSEIYIQAVG